MGMVERCNDNGGGNANREGDIGDEDNKSPETTTTMRWRVITLIPSSQ